MPADHPAPEPVIDALEALIFGAVGLTAAALSQSGATDLTVIQWRALVVIGRADNLRVGEVAGRLGASVTATSRLISRLERRGYVTSARDAADRRGILVGLTENGRDVRERVIGRRRQLMIDAIATRATPLPEKLAAGLSELAERLSDYR